MKRLSASYFPGKTIAILMAVLVLGACSTTKNTLVNRTYHTITTRYNGYFNARESYMEGKKRLEGQHIDNYEGVLSIFRYGTPQQAASVNSYMDQAYRKASIAIRRHSMNIRGVEYNNYIDKSYFLIARSHFFKGDYNLAILTFEYIVRQYDSPLVYESKVWIAKTQLFQGRYTNARQMLELFAKDMEQGLPGDDAIRLYHMVSADLHMRQNNYSEAIPALSAAIRINRERKVGTRLTFILGQLYHQTGDFSNAQGTFSRVLRMNPDFDLAFQARIRMAMAYDPASGNSESIRGELRRMLRDDKNRAYRDQIYFALGQLAMRENREEEAIDLYLESTKAGGENRLQKGLSFYQLAQIYYERPDYLKASAYYDSTTTFLPQSFSGYEEILQKRLMLTQLAGNIRTIAREDSLQRLAGMSAAERNTVIDEIIASLREKEQQNRDSERDRLRTRQSLAQNRQPGGQQDDGWYFYNPSSIAFGRTQFLSTFGERPREDLWRISNKQTLAFDFGMQAEGSEPGDPDAPPGSPMDRNVYLRNIPTTPVMMAESNRRIAQAYYNKGLIFRDRFKDNQSAVSSFESLISRFPDFENKLQAYYLLYNLHKELGDLSRADNFKNRILSEFPQSDIAQILGDPYFLENYRSRQNVATNLYTSSYNAFNAGRYQMVLDNYLGLDSLEMQPALRGQFAYLRALSLARLGNQGAFRQELQQIVQLYEGTSVHQPASDLLASLGSAVANTPVQVQEEQYIPETIDIPSVFSFKADAVHFFVMVIDVGQVDARELRIFINEFNKEHYGGTEFSMSNIFLDEKSQLITLTNFKNMQVGMEYYNRILASEGLKRFRNDAMKPFLISVDNYPVFYQEKNVVEYENFFRNRYLRK